MRVPNLRAAIDGICYDAHLKLRNNETELSVLLFINRRSDRALKDWQVYQNAKAGAKTARPRVWRKVKKHGA